VRPRVSSLLCLLLLTLSSCSAIASVGYDNPLAVYITYPAGDYGVGSSVTVTVHVFKEGARYDPDDVNLTAGSGDCREVTLTKQSVGRYTGTIMVAETDIANGYIGMDAMVGDGTIVTNWAWGYGYIDFSAVMTNRFKAEPDYTGLDVQMYSPGDTIEVRVLFTFDGSPVDPDEGDHTIEHEGQRGLRIGSGGVLHI
jgi:hypothetical protein